MRTKQAISVFFTVNEASSFGRISLMDGRSAAPCKGGLMHAKRRLLKGQTATFVVPPSESPSFNAIIGETMTIKMTLVPSSFQNAAVLAKGFFSMPLAGTYEFTNSEGSTAADSGIDITVVHN
jgi:hypothetical protein